MKALDAKLRAQAQRKGLKPGSPSWVKYVLGTQSRDRANRFAKSSPRPREAKQPPSSGRV
jgi:hypothetical protein